jgi:hypothetical protein
LGNLKEGHNLEELGIDDGIILKLTLKNRIMGGGLDYSGPK